MTSAELLELAVATDTQLADMSQALDSYTRKLSAAKRSLAREIGLKTTTQYGDKYKETLAEMIVLAEIKLGGLTGYQATSLLTTLEMIDAIKAQIADTEAQIAPLNDLYVEHQWSRFFIVQNNNGHIHSSMQCSTCFWDTRFGWLPQLSGLDEAAAVEAHGSILCSICYPTAPVEWTNGVSKVAQAEKDERAAAKLERNAAKAAKAITDVDGSPLKDASGYEIKTEVTARRELSSDLQYEYMEYGPKYTESAEHIAAAIANKTGESADELLKVGRVKAKKKIDAERKKYAA